MPNRKEYDGREECAEEGSFVRCCLGAAANATKTWAPTSIRKAMPQGFKEVRVCCGAGPEKEGAGNAYWARRNPQIHPGRSTRQEHCYQCENAGLQGQA